MESVRERISHKKAIVRGDPRYGGRIVFMPDYIPKPQS